MPRGVCRAQRLWWPIARPWGCPQCATLVYLAVRLCIDPPPVLGTKAHHTHAKCEWHPLDFWPLFHSWMKMSLASSPRLQHNLPPIRSSACLIPIVWIGGSVCPVQAWRATFVQLCSNLGLNLPSSREALSRPETATLLAKPTPKASFYGAHTITPNLLHNKWTFIMLNKQFVPTRVWVNTLCTPIFFFLF